jgi:hypothetical protein
VRSEGPRLGDSPMAHPPTVTAPATPTTARIVPIPPLRLPLILRLSSVMIDAAALLGGSRNIRVRPTTARMSNSAGGVALRR